MKIVQAYLNKSKQLVCVHMYVHLCVHVCCLCHVTHLGAAMTGRDLRFHQES